MYSILLKSVSPQAKACGLTLFFSCLKYQLVVFLKIKGKDNHEDQVGIRKKEYHPFCNRFFAGVCHVRDHRICMVGAPVVRSFLLPHQKP
jgi:hypothetical protein